MSYETLERVKGTDSYAVRKTMLPFLKQNTTPSPSKLINFLQDYGFPPIDRGIKTGYEDTPFQVISSYGFPIEGHHPATRTRLARSAAKIIDSAPDVLGYRQAFSEAERGPMTNRKDQYNRIMYNLLMLSASLSQSTILCDPLDRMYQRSKLQGSYMSLPHGDSLLAAISSNQRDNRFQQVWIDMLYGKEDPLLGGTPWEGFYSLLEMPEKTSSPTDTTIRIALDGIIRYIRDTTNLTTEESMNKNIALALIGAQKKTTSPITTDLMRELNLSTEVQAIFRQMSKS